MLFNVLYDISVVENVVNLKQIHLISDTIGK